MDIIIVFALLAFSVTATAWLSYVAGRRVGYQKGTKDGIRIYRHSLLNSNYGKLASEEWPSGKSEILRKKIADHNKRMGL